MTTFTTAGRTLFTTFTTESLPLERIGCEEGKFAAGEPFVWGCVAAVLVLPLMHAENASAATTPSARRARLMVMAPVCRVQAPFDTRHPGVHPLPEDPLGVDPIRYPIATSLARGRGSSPAPSTTRGMASSWLIVIRWMPV